MTREELETLRELLEMLLAFYNDFGNYSRANSLAVVLDGIDNYEVEILQAGGDV